MPKKIICYGLLLLFFCHVQSVKAKEFLSCKGMSKAELNAILSNEAITELNLDRCHLQPLMRNLNKYKKLEQLELFAAGISVLPDTIGELLNLKVLSLPKNSIKNIPVEIGKLHSLTELNLSQNAIETLPAEIGNLSNLVELNLSSNALKSLPDDIVKLEKLKSVDLSNNVNLVMNEKIKAWLEKIKAAGCEVIFD